ncbi:DNA-processing protein DprA [Alicyclobacillus macrosporangiidus]|uniref:DNA processing protein n=1 Tax=Alicyclobacillus macrosporangiidus TaxID=392015 RepID=A0A1I7IPS1_9BACL|nr:DNA-processing protein DprA [Alicyclobacillus macrosporangiidus]SFU74923.1 DNA processing protein [Alicyclobacillus macrosporangiidus]
MDERTAWTTLAACPGLEPSSLRRLADGFGGALQVLEAGPEQIRAAAFVRPRTASGVCDWLARIRGKDVESALARRGIRCLVQGDPGYPAPLSDLADPPRVLFTKGDIPVPWPRSIGVVGTRRATAYALEAAQWVAETLAGAGWNVVSGLALGIDGQAHRAALAAGRTTAVLGCGVDVCYPAQHQRLYEQVVASGLVISEYPPGMPVARHHFPERNRIIAALSEAIVVIQAGERSGALVTVDLALELGRDVYVVPGPITSLLFRGSNRLLQQGAQPLVDPLDLIQERGGERRPAAAAAPVPERWRPLYEALAEGASPAALAEWLQVPLGQVYAGLLELELAGVVEKRPGGGYRRVHRA